MSNFIAVGGGKFATVLFSGKRGKKNYVLSLFDVKGQKIRRGPYHKIPDGNPFFRIKFKNRIGIEMLQDVLSRMRDLSLFDQGAGKKSVSLKKSLRTMSMPEIQVIVDIITEEIKGRANNMNNVSSALNKEANSPSP